MEVSGTGIDVEPKLPKCPVPVLMSYPTYRLVRRRCYRWYRPAVCLGAYRAEHTFCMLFKMDYQQTKKKRCLLEFEKRRKFAFLRLVMITTRIRFRASDFGRVAKTIIVCTKRNRLHVRNQMRRWCSGHWFVCSCFSAVRCLKIEK